MVSQSSTQACFSKQHLIIPKKILHTLEYLSVISWIYILVQLGAVVRIRTYAPKGKLISFSCIVAVHHVPAAVNGCIAACVHYLKNMMTIKSNQNSKFFFWSGHWSRHYSQLTDRGKTCTNAHTQLCKPQSADKFKDGWIQLTFLKNIVRLWNTYTSWYHGDSQLSWYWEQWRKIGWKWKI